MLNYYYKNCKISFTILILRSFMISTFILKIQQLQKLSEKEILTKPLNKVHFSIKLKSTHIGYKTINIRWQNLHS